MSTTPALPTLSITALAPVATGTSFCRLAGVLWATVIVKASFQLVPGEAARLVAPLELIREDRSSAGSPRLETARETAPHVPNAGVVLTGHACAPDGRAVPSMSVRLGVLRDRPVVDKTIHVFGARATANPGAIAPFQKMPIVYERALGGAGSPENPVGTGELGSKLLPNFVDPRNPQKVAGFGPIAGGWAPRRALLRGLDPAVVEGAGWEVPAGFDWRFFQAAPADQQCDRLHGDEWIVLDGMDEALPRVQSRLPQVNALARRRVEMATGAVTEQAIELRADMLVIDADRRVASLIWRGRFAVEPLAALERTRVLVGLEMPGRPVAWPPVPEASRADTQTPQAPQTPRSVQTPHAQQRPQSPQAAHALETQEVNLAALLGGVVPFSGERESAAPPVPSGAVGSPGAAKPMFTGTESFDLRSLLKRPVPFAAAAEATELPVAAPAVTGSVIATLDLTPSTQGVELPFVPVDPSRPPPESVPTGPLHRPAPSYTGTADIDLAKMLKGATPYQAPSMAPVAPPVTNVAPPMVPVAPPVAPVAPPVAPVAPPVAPVAPPVAPVAPPVAPVAPPVAIVAPPMQPVILAAPAVIAAPSPAVASPPDRTSQAVGRRRKDAEEKLARKEPFDGESFEGANLSGLDLSGCSLVRCNLRGATLRGAKLIGAVLRAATLDEADLRGAVLEDADLSEASLLRANLERAKLARCHAEGVNLEEANLRGADLRGGRFAGASATGAVLRDATADRADFTAARLDHADLRGASLRDATLAGAVLAHANLEGANLQSADLHGANLHLAIRRMVKLAGANLTGVDEGPPAESTP